MTLSRHQALAVLRAGAALLLVARASPSRASPRRDRRIRVVVVGAGFGGLSAASCLAAHPGIDLTVIDRTDHHRFQPLLYQVATAALSPSDIAAAVPAILPAGPGVRILQATVTGIDTAGRSVLCDGLSVPYDELILSTGSRPSCFGHGSRAAAAPGLKTLDDAPALRSTILGAFDRARLATGVEQETLPTFVLIGGGPIGVEMAGSIAELANDRLRRGHAATAPRARIIRVSTIVWTAGTEATPVAAWLGIEPAHGGRVKMGPDLRVPEHAGITVISEAALATGRAGKPMPGLAPVAKQQGRFVARSILRRRRGATLRRRRGATALRRFTYRDYGTLATIGRSRAVAELGPWHLRGFSAWLLWAAAPSFFLIGFRNRFMVLARWAFAYATNQRPGQLPAAGQSAERTPLR